MSDDPIPVAKVVAGATVVSSNDPAPAPEGVTVIPTYALYTPGQVAGATFVGGPLAGGWLIAANDTRLGRSRRALWTIAGTILGTLALLAVAIFVMSGGGPIVSLATIFVMQAIAKHSQGELVHRHMADGGRRASSWGAFGIGAASLAITLTVAFAIGFGVAMATQPDDLAFGRSNVIYASGGTRDEAQAVGLVLQRIEYFRDDAPATVEVRHDGDRHVVEFVVQPSVLLDHELQLVFHGLSQDLADALGGGPVDVWLTDDELVPRRKFRWEDRPRIVELGAGHTVVARDGGTEPEARAVADVLTAASYFTGGPSTVIVQRDGSGRHVVAFTVNDRAFDDAEMQRGFLAYANKLSARAFANEPVDVWLNDVHSATRIKMTWEQRSPE